MQGFAAGRLQTGGRASGLAQAALEVTATYAGERKQFGRPIGDFQLTQYKLGRMATHLAAARQLTYAAARADGRRRVDLARALHVQALRLRRRGVGDAGGAAPPRRLGLRRGVRDLAPRGRRHGAADLRGREAHPRAEGDRAAAACRVERARTRTSVVPKSRCNACSPMSAPSPSSCGAASWAARCMATGATSTRTARVTVRAR